MCVEANARDDWIARASDEQIVLNVTACKLALTTRAHDFLKANNGPNFLRAVRALSLHFPPIQRMADGSERIEDLSDIPDAELEKMRLIRDAARGKRKKGAWIGSASSLGLFVVLVATAADDLDNY